MPRKNAKSGNTHQKNFTKRVKQVLKRLVEKKYYNPSDTSQPFGTTAATVIEKMLPPAQGTTDSERVGDKLQYTHISFKATVYQNVNQAFGCTQRLIIFQWKPDDDQLAPSATQCFQPDTGVNNVNAVKMWDLRNTWTILYDKTFFLGVINSENSVVSKHLSGTINCKKLISLKLRGGTQDGQGCIYMALISDCAADPPAINYVMQMQFEDL